MKALWVLFSHGFLTVLINKERYMFDQDDQRNSQPYTGEPVIGTITRAPRTTGNLLDKISDLLSGSTEPIPMPLQATGLSPMDYDLGSQITPFEISETEPPMDRLEKTALNFVLISQLIGNGQWVEITTKEYAAFCDRKITPAERSLMSLDLVSRKCLVVTGDRYRIGPQMAFLLSKYVKIKSVAA